MNKEQSYQQLIDPNFIGMNRLEAHTIFDTYDSLEKALNFDKPCNVYSLDGEWRFQYSENLNEKVDEFYSVEYDWNDWDKIKVPGHIQLQGYGRPQYLNRGYAWDGIESVVAPNIPIETNAVGSYIKTFALPKEWSDKLPCYIRFDGVESSFHLWLNGQLVGYSEDSFTPASFDLSPYLRQGNNTLAVEVYKYCSGSWLEDQDFFRFSGIFRSVCLEQKQNVHLYDFDIKTQLNETLTLVDIKIFMKVRVYKEEAVELSCFLYDGYKCIHEFGSKFNFLRGGDGYHSFCFSEVLNNIKLWSAEKPNLYTLVMGIETKENKAYVPYKIGFRKFEIRNRRMYLNNRKIIFNGVNRHEFSADKGRAIDEETMLWDIRQLKRNNINAVRTSHYPNNHLWYRLCDEYGVYVIDEVNLETHGSWRYGQNCQDSAIPASKPEWMKAVMDRARSMYERDKNHPSIVIWSLGNESYGGSNFVQMKEYFKRKDSSRVVHYEGVYHDRNFHDATEIESTMYLSPKEVLAYLEKYKEKPYIQCEYAHAMGNSLGCLEEYTALAEKNELYQGGFIWDYIDQALRTKNNHDIPYLGYGGDFGDFPNTGNFSGNGLVFADRTISPKMPVVKYCYQNVGISLDVKKWIVTFKNRFLFQNLNEFEVILKIQRDGHEVYKIPLSVDLGPGDQLEKALPEYDMENSGVWVVSVHVLLKEATVWADKGYEVAYGEMVKEVGISDEKVIKDGSLRLVEGIHLITVTGQRFSCAFSRQQKRWISYQYDGEELLGGISRPNFWRAPTDNDIGALVPFECAFWKTASTYIDLVNFKVNEQGSRVEIYSKNKIPGSKDIRCDVNYTIFSDGEVEVSVYYKGREDLPIMPELSFMFSMPMNFSQMQWFGLGPHETYSDRKGGAKYGVYESDVSNNLTPYLNPQESGKKSDVKWVKVFDSEGKGLKVTKLMDTIDISVLPYTPDEVEMASHEYELPPVDKTVVRVIYKQMGVGGDDSWGAKPHKEHLIPAEQEYHYKFSIKGITGGR